MRRLPLRARIGRRVAVALAVISLAGCDVTHRDLDVATTADAVVAAMAQVEPKFAAQSPPTARMAWEVRVYDSVDYAPDLSRQLATRLRIGPALPNDTLRGTLDVQSAHATRRGLVLRIDVGFVKRCGPTWQSTWGYSGDYEVQSHRVGDRWVVDSVRPVIFGDPGVCQTMPDAVRSVHP